MITFTIKSVKTLKEGENQAGHYVLRGLTFQETVRVFEQDGKEHTFMTGSTFDVIDLAAGDEVEAEAEITNKGGKTYLNLKKLTKAEIFPEPVPPATPKAPETLKEAIKMGAAPIPDNPQLNNNGAARGMATNEIGAMIRASNEKELKFVALVFGDKAPDVISWYRSQILTIAGIK